MEHDGRPLPRTASRLLEDLAGALRVDSLHLFGGAALDLLGDPTATCRDLDVALLRTDPIEHHLERLTLCPDIEVVGSPRQYWIRHSCPVVMVEARWRENTLDVNFVDDMRGIGHFDIECVHWAHPEQTLSDPHGATVRAVHRFRLVSPPDSDNPLLLINRVLKLSAKYEVSFWQSRHLRTLISELASKPMPSGAFHGLEAHAAHLRAVATSVRQSRRPAEFLRGCLQTDILDARLAPLATALRHQPHAIAELADAATGDMFWAAADRLVSAGGPTWRGFGNVGEPGLRQPGHSEGNEKCGTG